MSSQSLLVLTMAVLTIAAMLVAHYLWHRYVPHESTDLPPGTYWISGKRLYYVDEEGVLRSLYGRVVKEGYSKENEHSEGS